MSSRNRSPKAMAAMSCAGFVDDFAHPVFVLLIGTGPGKHHRPERQAGGFRLFFDQFPANGVHGDAVECFVESRQQADKFKFALLAQEM